MKQPEPYRPRVYLAARFERLDELKRWRDYLDRSFSITSTWLDLPDVGAEARATDQERCDRADRDLWDLWSSDALVLLNPEDDREGGHGGRHVETGIAMAQEIPIFLVGARTNVFHYLPDFRLISEPDPVTVEAALQEYFRQNHGSMRSMPQCGK